MPSLVLSNKLFTQNHGDCWDPPWLIPYVPPRFNAEQQMFLDCFRDLESGAIPFVTQNRRLRYAGIEKYDVPKITPKGLPPPDYPMLHVTPPNFVAPAQQLNQVPIPSIPTPPVGQAVDTPEEGIGPPVAGAFHKLNFKELNKKGRFSKHDKPFDPNLIAEETELIHQPIKKEMLPAKRYKKHHRPKYLR